MKLPLIRSLAVAPARAPILRYGVALLSAVLALIPTLFFSDLAESRLVVFAVAVMVSAWYGGWKPGLAATSFALTVSAYYSLIGAQTPAIITGQIAHLGLFFAVALLICWFNAALRATQESLRLSESNFRSLVMNAPYGICRCDALGILQDANPRWSLCLVTAAPHGAQGPASRKFVCRRPAMVPNRRLFSLAKEFNNLTTECVRKDGSAIVARISGRSIRTAKKAAPSRFLWKTLPKPARWSCNSVRRKKWKRSAAWPAVSRMTSTIC
jgi:PAS domain-containing protein